MTGLYPIPVLRFDRVTCFCRHCRRVTAYFHLLVRQRLISQVTRLLNGKQLKRIHHFFPPWFILFCYFGPSVAFLSDLRRGKDPLINFLGKEVVTESRFVRSRLLFRAFADRLGRRLKYLKNYRKRTPRSGTENRRSGSDPASLRNGESPPPPHVALITEYLQDETYGNFLSTSPPFSSYY